MSQLTKILTTLTLTIGAGVTISAFALPSGGPMPDCPTTFAFATPVSAALDDATDPSSGYDVTLTDTTADDASLWTPVVMGIQANSMAEAMATEATFQASYLDLSNLVEILTTDVDSIPTSFCAYSPTFSAPSQFENVTIVAMNPPMTSPMTMLRHFAGLSSLRASVRK